MYIYTYIYICIYIHVHDKHHGTYDDIKVQIINYCDANDQERREDFWIFNLNTLEPNGLNNKRAQKN